MQNEARTTGFAKLIGTPEFKRHIDILKARYPRMDVDTFLRTYEYAVKLYDRDALLPIREQFEACCDAPVYALNTLPPFDEDDMFSNLPIFECKSCGSDQISGLASLVYDLTNACRCGILVPNGPRDFYEMQEFVLREILFDGSGNSESV